MVDLRKITGGLKLGGFLTALSLEACFGVLPLSTAQAQTNSYGYVQHGPSHIPVAYPQLAYPSGYYPQQPGVPPQFVVPAQHHGQYAVPAPCPQCAPAPSGSTTGESLAAPEGVADDSIEYGTPYTNNYEAYPDVADLSGDVGYASAPQSATPHMIGDFFAPKMAPIVVQPPSFFGPTVSQSIEFEPLGGNPGENTPSVATNGQPVEFAVLGGNVAGVTIPPTVLQSLVNFEATGVVAVGDTFAVGSFDPAFQDAIRQAIIALYGPGSVAYTGGVAEFATDNGAPGFDGTSDEFFLTQTVDFTPLVTPQALLIHIPNPSGGGTVGRVKISDNNSAMPVDRFFFDTSWFHNPAVGPNDTDVVRFVPGVEKTFINPIGGMLSSVEMRFPMASTADSTIIANGITGRDTEIGNFYAGIKTLVHHSCHWAVALGIGATLPTGDDIDSTFADGTPIALIENESVHVLPYWAVQWTPNEKVFGHLFVQYDFEAGNNTVFLNQDLLGGGTTLTEAGQWNDQIYQFIDAGIGKWLYRNYHCHSGITGFACTAEVHYVRSLNDGDEINSGIYTVGSRYLQTDLLNATVGGHLQLAGHTTATLGYAMPVNSDERVFDGEMRFFVNRRF